MLEFLTKNVQLFQLHEYMQNNFSLKYPKFITIELNRRESFKTVNLEKKILGEINFDQIISVSFFGSDVFEYPYFNYFWEKLGERNIITSVDVIMKKKDFDDFNSKVNLFSQIRFNIFSANAKIHDTLIKEKNNFNNFYKTIVNNQESNFKKKSKVIIMPISEENGNEKEIFSLYRFAQKNNFFFSPFISSKFDKESCISKGTYKKILKILSKLYFCDDSKILFLDEPLVSIFTNESNYCPAGRLLIHIDADGNIYPCRYSKFKIGNFLSSVEVVWRRFLKYRENCPGCGNCKISSLCGHGCFAAKKNPLYDKDKFCFYSRINNEKSNS